MAQELDLFARFVPGFAKTVLHVGCRTGELARAIKAERPAQVYGLALNDADAAQAESSLDGVVVAGATQRLPVDAVDAVVLDRALTEPRHFNALLALSLSFMDANGRYLFLTRHPGSWRVRAGVQRALVASHEDLESLLTSLGLAVFDTYALMDPAAEACVPDATGTVQMGGYTFTVASDEELQVLATMGQVVVAVRDTYQPAAHARLLADEGRYDEAYSLLELLPQPFLKTPEEAVGVATECQQFMARLAETLPDDVEEGSVDAVRHQLRAFCRSQAAFYTAVWATPGDGRAYQHQAEFWRRIGNANMAARMLRTYAAFAPEAAARIGLDAPSAIPPAPEQTASAPAWDPASPPLSILLITHPRPHYELDIVFAGLCAALGSENVSEFPWKGTLHGEIPAELAHYPCSYNIPGTPLTLDAVVAQLREGRFDAVVFGDIERDMEKDAVRQIVDASGDVPWFVLDGQDDCENHTRRVLDYLGVPSVAGYFKREMLAGVQYSPNTWPLPFAYPDERVPAVIDFERPNGLFWAGLRRYGMRRAYLEHIESNLGLSLNVRYSQEEYARALLTHRIGLNIFGMGFDTVRYWEVPAHGCMLLSERLPIHIPYDFEDGVSAVFYEDLPELMDKLTYYLDRPEECAAIARAGHDHLVRYHTGSARARQMLGWIQSRLRDADAS